MSDLHPVQGWPGYSVNRLGQVYGDRGALSCDSAGRVALRHKETRRTRRLHVGAVMELAGLLTRPDEEGRRKDEHEELSQQVEDLRVELAKAEQTIARGRKLNGHLLHLVRSPQSEPAKKPVGRPKKMCCDPDDEYELPGTPDFEDWSL